MDDILCGYRRAVVKTIVLAQIKVPSLGVFDFPVLHQQTNMLPFLKIISTEASQDLAPDAIHESHAVAIGVERLHGFRNADGNARLGGSQPAKVTSKNDER
jgi:hypothetical protein